MNSRGVYSLQPNTIQHYDKQAKAGDPRLNMVGVGEKGEAGGMRRGREKALCDSGQGYDCARSAPGRRNRLRMVSTLSSRERVPSIQ